MSADDVFYRRFFEALPDAAFVLDLQTASFVDVNEALVAMYGWSRDELATPGVVELSAEPEASRAALKAPLNGVYPRRHRRRDGTVFPVETSAARVDFDGRPYVVGVTRDVSTQHRYEAELRGRKALIASAFDTSPLMISICTFPERRLIEVNEAFCRGTGFSREEVLGRTTGELGVAVPDQLAAHQAQLEASGRVDGREFAYQSRSGVRVPVRVWSQVLETSQGPRLFTAAEDITARKQDEAVRAELVARIEKIASRLPGVVYQFRRRPDGSLSFPYASPALEALYGVNPEAVKEDGRPAFAWVHPDDLAAMIESTEVSARDLTPWTFEHRVVRPDGTVRWMQGNAVPEREPDGSTLWHGFIADVTEQKARQVALRVSEERFKLAMEATSDALWDWDFAAGTAYASPNYARSLGYEPAEFPSGFTAWEQHVHPDDRAAAIAASMTCIEGPAERFESEFRMRTRDGNWRWFLSRGQCLSRDANGRATRLLGTNADITERKNLQLSLAQTERLASMGLLAAGVAHEINNPLSYVHTNLDSLATDLPRVAAVTRRALEALRAKGGDAAVARALGSEGDRFDELLTAATEALDGAHRIRKISRGLGTFARAETAEQEPVDVNEAIESAATMAQGELKSRARLVKDLGVLPAVRGSEGRLAQVFLNLFVNAAHAIDAGAPDTNELRVRSWANGAEVHVEVKDSGRGIAPEHLSRIFEPFFTTKRAGVGSGLGLPISRSIVMELGGTLRVDSELGRGTVVHVQLPGLPTVAPRPSRPQAVPATKPVTGRARVLVVDDEAPIRRSLQRVLREHDVVTVASGREAKALLEHDARFDVVLCDLMMPEMTGMELHAWLAIAHPSLAARVIFVSGGAFTPSAAEYLEKVKTPQLQKPFDTSRLKALVAERMNGPR